MIQHPYFTLNTIIPQGVFKFSGPLARIGNILLWIGETIILLSKDKRKIELIAAVIKLTAGAILILAAIVEGQEVKSYSGIMPKETPPKVIGSVISEIGAIILTAVLYYELSTNVAPSEEPITSPFLGGLT
jgi:hypothetical protein